MWCGLARYKALRTPTAMSLRAGEILERASNLNSSNRMQNVLISTSLPYSDLKSIHRVPAT